MSAADRQVHDLPVKAILLVVLSMIASYFLMSAIPTMGAHIEGTASTTTFVWVCTGARLLKRCGMLYTQQRRERLSAMGPPLLR